MQVSQSGGRGHVKVRGEPTFFNIVHVQLVSGGKSKAKESRVGVDRVGKEGKGGRRVSREGGKMRV